MLYFYINQQLCRVLERTIDLDPKRRCPFQILSLINNMTLGKLSHFSETCFSIYKMINVNYAVFKISIKFKWKTLCCCCKKKKYIYAPFTS